MEANQHARDVVFPALLYHRHPAPTMKRANANLPTLATPAIISQTA
jgi:hypothetical protein